MFLVFSGLDMFIQAQVYQPIMSRVIQSSKLPTSQDSICSMKQTYNQPVNQTANQLLQLGLGIIN